MPELSHLKGYNGGNIRDAQIGEEKAKVVLKSIMLGVKHIHDKNYVHRDIKPANICFENPNDLSSTKIIDFGNACKINNKTQKNYAGGTLIYQAPEQIFPHGNISKASDIFTCGFIMFELISGRHPVLIGRENKEAYKKRMK